jgi:magnesium chelatase family protein
VARFPARFQLVAAANPCPCGQHGSRDGDCVCTPIQRRRYHAKLSGPLVDRIDIQLQVARISSAQFRLAETAEVVTTASARARVEEARARSAARLADTPWRLNAEVSGTWLRSPARRLPLAATRPADRALESGALTMRGYDRVLKVAWTLADLDGVDVPGHGHVARALGLRRSL